MNSIPASRGWFGGFVKNTNAFIFYSNRSNPFPFISFSGFLPYSNESSEWLWKYFTTATDRKKFIDLSL